MSLSIKTSEKMQLSKLQLPKLLPNLFAGLISGLVALTYSISFAALIFSGSLSAYFPQGVGIALTSSVIAGVVVALRSTFPFAIAGPDPNSAPILALMASAIAVDLEASGASIFPTVWMAIALGSFFTGLFLYLIGRLHLGRWARFIPYTVMGGFLAGTGWLIIRSSFKVMADLPLGWDELPRLIQWDTLVHWLPGLIFAVVLIGAGNFYQHVLILPTMLLGAIALFHLFWWLVNAFVPLVPQGWFLEPFPRDQLWDAWKASTITQVDWAVLASHSGTLIAMMVVVVIAILLNSTGIELATQRDSELDSELRANGIANLITGLGGGMVGHINLNRSLLNLSAGASNPLAGLIAAALCGTVLLFGSAILAYIPRPILGGLLLVIGLKLLFEWVYSAWFKFPRLEYALILIILVSIAAWGFIEGIGVGIVIACTLFAFSYSRHQVIRHTFPGTTHQSNVRRSFPEEQILRQKGDQIHILLLQGYIFFGTANALLGQVRTRLENPELPPIQFLVMDFRLVNGVDSSVVLSFIKIRQLAQKHQLKLVFTHLQPTIRQQLQQGGGIDPYDEMTHIFPDLDRGIEWCENKILETLSSLRRRRSLPLALQLNEVFADAEQVSSFISYLEQLQVPADHILFRQGDSDSLYFIESGQITVFLQLDNGQTRRVQTLSAGTIVGEIAFYLGTPHNTSAIADQPSKLYCLTTASLRTMQQENPQAVAAFQSFVIRLLANRLVYAYEEIEELL